MATEKITKKNCLESIIEILKATENAGVELPGKVSYNDMIAYAEGEIAALDKKAAQAQKRAAEKKAQGDDLREKVLEAVPYEAAIAIDDIVEALDDPNVTRNMVISRLNQLGEKRGTGQVTQEDVEIATPDGKTRKVSGYRRIG